MTGRRSRVQWVAAGLLLGMASAQAAAPGPAGTPVGTWRTFDDADGTESGSVTIVERDGLLYGDVTSIKDPAKAHAICQACTGARKDKPVVGLEIMSGLRPDGAAWDGGEVLDPKTGQTYRCSVRLTDGGQKLVVRGFVGVAVFGRNQTWVREGG